MAEKLEDFNLPYTIITKIVKDAISDVNLSKDARTALARAGSVFILYLTSQAFNISQAVNRRTLLGQDVLDALENLEFDELVEPLKQYFEEYKEAEKKQKADKQKKAAENVPVEEEEEEDEEAEEESEKESDTLNESKDL